MTGLSRRTITKTGEELESGEKRVSVGDGRVRRVGGGRKKIEGIDPGRRGSVDQDPGGNGRWGSEEKNESVALDPPIDSNPGRGVDSFRAPRVGGDK